MKKMFLLVVFLLINLALAFADENISETNITEELEADLEMTDFIPKEFEVGDVQLNIEVENTGDMGFNNLKAFVSGDGFYTNKVLPIGALEPGETSYIVVLGKFEDPGQIKLSITIEDFVFYQVVDVTDPNKELEEERLEQLKEEQEKQAALNNLTFILEDLEINYTKLDIELNRKKELKYDVDDISLKELKDYLRKLRSDISVEDVEQAKASLDVVLDEYEYQKNKVSNATLIKEPFIEKMRSNALLISSLAASVITVFALFELLHKKKESIKKIVEVKYANGKTETKIKETNENQKKFSRSPFAANKNK